jgi:DNA-binding transcriptional LysR family regulator
MHLRMPRKATRKAKTIELERWDDLHLLLAVARAGSFTHAAKLLDIEQSTVSRRMRSLEESLGVALFERHPQRSVLTPIGEKLLRRAEAIEAEVHGLCDEAGGVEREVKGHVRLALTESIAVYGVIPRVLPKLQKQYPELHLELITSYVPADLGHREAEIALRFFRPRSGDLVAQRIVTMQTAVLAHKRLLGRPLTELKFITVALEGIPTLEAEFLRKHLGTEPHLITSSYLVQVEAVRAGLGAAILPRNLLRLDSSLVELDVPVPKGPTLELWLVTPRSLRAVPRIDAVWTALETGLAELNGLTDCAAPAL